jgi:hypothetical protein
MPAESQREAGPPGATAGWLAAEEEVVVGVAQVEIRVNNAWNFGTRALLVRRGCW